MSDQLSDSTKKPCYKNIDGEIYEIKNGELIFPEKLICHDCGKETDWMSGGLCKSCHHKMFLEYEASRDRRGY
jgi:rRNA maturation endonuclease Nob1